MVSPHIVTSVRIRSLSWILLSGSLIIYFLSVTETSTAQVTSPITSSGLNTTITQNGNTYSITGGTRPENGFNLFHSFGEFGVPPTNIANFLNETELPTDNILGRVTSGNPSNIFGSVQTTGFDNANLFLMNPAGFLFGPTATINVGGMMTFTSADYMKLADGACLNAIPNAAADALLTASPVATFGFLGSNPGAITVQGSRFRVTEGTGISLIGGDITVQSGVLDDAITIQPARLTAPGGQINIAGVASAGEVSMTSQGLQPSQPTEGGLAALGNISLSQGTSIDSSGTIAGPIFILGGRFVMDASSIHAMALGNSGDAGGPTGIPTPIAITADTVVLRNGTLITASTEGTAPAGDITFNVGAVEARPGSNSVPLNAFQITGNLIASDSQSRAANAGHAGTITIQGVNGPGSAAGTISLESSTLSTRVFGGTADTSPAAISLTADSVAFSDSDTALILPPSQRNPAATLVATSLGPAPAGNIALNVNTLRVNVNQDGTPIEGARRVFINNPSVSPDSTAGPAGSITISGLDPEATDAAKLVALYNAQISSAVEGGTAALTPGAITITADTMSLSGATGIFAFTFGAAPAGNVAFNVNQLRANVQPDGTLINGQPQSFINSISFIDDSTAGRAGTLTVSGLGPESTDAAKLVALNNTEFSTAVNGGTEATIPATITMTADTLSLTHSRNIKADTSGAAPAGNMTFNANNLTANHASQISSSTSGSGPGGNISINADQSVTLNNESSISASSTGPGNAGNVTISSDSLTVASGGRIEASTSGAGDGGSIAITTTGDVTVSGVSADGQVRSGIFAKTLSGGGSGGGGGGSGGGSGGGGGGAAPKLGSAGDIAITANNLRLDGGAQIDSSTTSGGAGGSISITTTAGNITIAGSSTRLTSDATRGNGKGGNITMVAKNITVRDRASVTAATGGKGPAGNITLTALDQLLLQSAGTITTSTSGSGEGGTIVIKASQVLLDGQGTGVAADTLRPFADMTITIDILHPNDGDLVVQLDSPTGTRVALLSRVGGSGDNFTGTQFNDQATTQITSGSAPFTGTFTPREPLGQLNNELVAGNWALNVRDQATDNIGSLESWTLQIGDQTFQSTGGSREIPDNGNNVRSTITVAAPTGPTVQGVGEAPGIGGDVTINADTVTVQNGATMSATTRGSGQGGTLTVNATGAVALTGSGSGFSTDSEASGTGGNIALTAGHSVTMSDDASITASSTRLGNAGNISINAGQTFVATDSMVTTQANQASGGTIKITTTPSGMVQLTNSMISASVLDGTGGGGSVNIDPQMVILQNSQILAQAVRGPGGNISITTNLFLPDANSVFSASSQFGVNGTVTIQSPNSPASGKIQPLGNQPLEATSLLNQRCAALAGGEFSSFTVAGRDSLPAEPGSWLASPLAMLSAGSGLGMKGEREKSVAQGEGLESVTMRASPAGESSVLSLRQMAPAGFLTQAFAVDWSAGCQS